MDFTYREEKDYLVVEVNGSWELNEVKQHIEVVRDRVAELAIERVLIDCRELVTPLDTLTRFLTGEYIAEFWRPPVKVAALSSPEMLNDKFAEIVAVNRGAWFAVFLEEEPAMKWLLEGSKANGAK